ncbi:MAG: DEAD/DEAH box helicase, partial [Litorimonas sp.]
HICEIDEEPPKKGCHALILAPTRELATQISTSISSYGEKMPYLSVVTVFGGVPIHRQIKRVSGGVDVIVATPGRLIDLLERGSVKLGNVRILVLDEADQMMDMGFIDALKKIVPLLPKKRQTLLFSATMVPKIKRLAEQFLTKPKTISVTPPNSTAAKVEQRVTFVTKHDKATLLGLSLLAPDMTRAIVFTRTKHGADRVVKRLREYGIDSRAIHGNKSQAQRQRTLEAFRNNEVNVLIATDVAARGIDIPAVSHVFNYEIPNVPEQYVHRIGRTGRANLAGVAHAFVDSEERAYLKDIQKLLKKDIPKVDLPKDFLEQVKAMKLRPSIPAPAKPQPDSRKGRGKGRSKSKRNRKDQTSKDSGKGERSDSHQARTRQEHPAKANAKSKHNSSRQEGRSDNSDHKQNRDEKSPYRTRRKSSAATSDKPKQNSSNREGGAKRKGNNGPSRDEQSPHKAKRSHGDKASGKPNRSSSGRHNNESRKNTSASKSGTKSPNKPQLKRGKRKQPTKR